VQLGELVERTQRREDAFEIDDCGQIDLAVFAIPCASGVAKSAICLQRQVPTFGAHLDTGVPRGLYQAVRPLERTSHVA
jgi:hypothetical protein